MPSSPFDFIDEKPDIAQNLDMQNLIWNILTGLMLVGTLFAGIIFLSIFVNPQSRFNPFPPAALPTMVVPTTATPTPKNLLPPTWTPDSLGAPIPTMAGGAVTSTPQPTGSQCFAMRFPDGSEIYVSKDTEIEISKLAGSTSGASGHELLLNYGRVLVMSQLPEGEWFTVIGSEGQIARVTGSMMQVELEQITGQFTVGCISGVCQLGPNIQNLFQLAEEDQGALDGDGNILGLAKVNLTELYEGCGGHVVANEPTRIPTATPTATATPTITPTPTATADLNATATAQCEVFESENPGTPCP